MLSPIVFPPGVAHHDLNPSISGVSSSTNTGNLSSYTFLTMSLGSAATSRIIVVTASTNATGISSITVNGVLLTNVAGASGVMIAYASIPTGTTATIVVNLLGTAGRCAVEVYAIYDLEKTSPITSDYEVASNVTLSLWVPTNSVAIGIAMSYNNGADIIWGSPMITFVENTLEDSRHSSAKTGLMGWGLVNFNVYGADPAHPTYAAIAVWR